jgi:hypothetical protein
MKVIMRAFFVKNFINARRSALYHIKWAHTRVEGDVKPAPGHYLQKKNGQHRLKDYSVRPLAPGRIHTGPRAAPPLKERKQQ